MGGCCEGGTPGVGDEETGQERMVGEVSSVVLLVLSTDCCMDSDWRGSEWEGGRTHSLSK